MEDDGATGARSRDDRAAQAGPVRPARRGRLGVGRGQGLRLAGHHHPDARVHPGPRLLPDRQPDRGAGRPGLVPDQPVPARERDPALPGAGRRASRRGTSRRPSWPCRRRGPTARPSQLGTKLLYIGGTDGTAAQSTVYVAQLVRRRQLRLRGPRARPLPEPRSDASVVQVSGTVYVLGGLDADGAPTTTVYTLTPDPQTGALAEWETAPEELVLPEAALGRGRRGGARRHAADRRRGPGRPGRDDLEEPVRRAGRAAEVGDGGPAPAAAGRRDGRDRRRPRLAVRRARRERAGRDRPARRPRTRGGRGLPREPERGQGRRVGREPGREPARAARRRDRLDRQRRRSTSSAARPPTARSARPTGRSRRAPARSPSGSTSRSATCRTACRAGPSSSPGPNAIIVGGETAEGAGRDEPAREHRAAEPVLPARPGRAPPSRASRSTARSASSSAT